MGSHLHFFTIPANAGTAEQDALNVFLASNRVVALEKQWISAGADSSTGNGYLAGSIVSAVSGGCRFFG